MVKITEHEIRVGMNVNDPVLLIRKHITTKEIQN
jgi:hypothetical protein